MNSHLNALWDVINANTLFFIIIVAGMFYSIFAKKLTVPAACTGGVIASVIFVASGLTGVAMMTTFFILGSLATSWGKEHKNKITFDGNISVRRKVSQVLANAGVSAFAGLLIICYPHLATLLMPVMAAAFASATADTLSSELGMIYGSRYFNLISLKPDLCGKDGVVSIEGTLIGIVGSCVIALTFALGYGFKVTFYWIALAGIVGNLVDSALGALLERKGLIGNDSVNFLSTLSAGLVALLLGLVFQ